MRGNGAADAEKYRNRYGFQTDEVSLYDAFTLDDVQFRDAIPENTYIQVCLQNRKLWTLTAKSRLLVKNEVDEDGFTKRGDKRFVEDPRNLRNAKINKVLVDKSGMHCLILTDTDLLYNHWESDIVSKIEIEGQNGSNSSASQTAPSDFNIRSFDILTDIDDNNFFQICLGTSDGQILHGAVEAQGDRFGTCSVVGLI